VARRIVANIEEGGRPYRPFCPFTVTQSGGSWTRDPAGDSGDGGLKLRRGGGARLRLWGHLWERLRGWCSLNEAGYKLCLLVLFSYSALFVLNLLLLFGLFQSLYNSAYLK
jgi:hypothetical protein